MLCKTDGDDIYSIPIWIVELSNGEHIYQYTTAEWIELHDYIYENQLNIENIILRFRSNRIAIPKGDGYYISLGAAGFMGGPQLDFNLFIVGHVVGDKVYAVEYKIPELITMPNERVYEVQDLLDNKKLILNNVQKTNQTSKVPI